MSLSAFGSRFALLAEDVLFFFLPCFLFAVRFPLAVTLAATDSAASFSFSPPPPPPTSSPASLSHSLIAVSRHASARRIWSTCPSLKKTRKKK